MRKTICLLFAFCFALAARADTGVNDAAKMFKPETVQKADADLRRIKDDYGKELVVETFPTIPDSRKPDWDLAKDDPTKRAEFFSAWLGDEAHEKKVNGVYVLICKDPGHLEVAAGAKTKLKAFTETNQQKLRDTLIESFKTKDYDEGLEKAVQYFRTALKDNLGAPRQATHESSSADEHFRRDRNIGASRSPSPAPTPANANVGRSMFQGSSCMWVGLVIIGAIIIVRILGSLGASRGGGPGSGAGGYGGGNYGGGNMMGGGNYGPNYGGGGGGGFFRNMLGGMLGGAAGGYLYDRFRDRNEGSSNINPGGYSGGTPDNSASGGDFGSSPSASDNDQGQGFGGGSGGDFGSSDAGSSSDSGSSFDSGSSGGDSGGGDSGGSGGDF